MATSEEAVFNVRVKMNTEDIDRAIAESLAKIEAVQARVASGQILPAQGQAEITEIAAQAYAQSKILGAHGGDRAQADQAKITSLLSQAGDAVGTLVSDLKESDKVVKRFNTEFIRMGNGLLRPTVREQAKVDARVAANEVAADPQNADEIAQSKLKADLEKQAAANRARVDQAEAIAAQEAENLKLAAQETAALLKMLSLDDEYLQAQATALAAKKKHAAGLEALVQQELAGIGGATAAERQRLRSESDRYISDRARADAFRKSTEAKVGVQSTQQLLEDPDYSKDRAKEQANNARLLARENVLLARALEQDQEYLANTARASASRKRQAAAIENAAQRELAGAGISPTVKAASERYVKNLAEAEAFRKQTQARVAVGTQTQLAADPGYAQNQGQLAALRQKQQVQEGLITEQILAADKDLAAETGKLAALRRSRQIAERQAFLQQQDVRAEGQLAFQEDYNKSAIGVQKIRARDSDPLLAASERANQATIAADEYKESVAKRAAIARLSVKDEEEVRQNLATAKVAETERNLAVQQMVRTKLGTAFMEREIQEEVAQQAVNEARRSSLLTAQLAQDESYFRMKGQNLVQAKVLAERERAAASAALQEQIRSGAVARGSFVQRVQQRVASRTGGAIRLPQDFATGPQLLQGAAVTTARFAVSGAALYGGFAVISKAVKEAQELEKVFNQIRRQFEGLGKADQFEGFRTQILAIARETGAAGAEVANVGFQLQGAFGGDTGRALRETESAFKAVRVTGLSITEVIDAFTALTENFDAAGVTIENVSDKALGLQERFGVLAKETISFAADLAPVAAQAGFTVQQLEAIGAVGQKYSGRSGTSLAEAFGRILPSIQANAVQFTQLFQQFGDNDVAAAVTEAFREGNIAGFFEILLRQYKNLSEAQRNYVIELLGGRREAQSLIPVLENSSELLNEFANAEDDAGKTSEYFGDLQRTLTQQLAELGEQFQQLAVQIYNSGLKDFLEDLIGLAGGFVDAFSGVVNILTEVGDAITNLPIVGSALGGGLSSIIEAVLIYKGVGALGRFGGARLGLGGGTAAAAGFTTGGQPLASTGFEVAGAVAGGGAASGIRNRILAGRAAQVAATAEGASAARGLGAGLKTAFGGFSWVGLGTTIGLLAVQELGNSIAASASKRIGQLTGPDGRLSDEEFGAASRAEKTGGASSVAGLLADVAPRPGGGGIATAGEIDEVRTLSDLRDRAVQDANRQISQYQAILDLGDNVPILPSFSKDAQQNRAVANAQIDEIKARYTEAFTEIANNEELLAEVVRFDLEGTLTPQTGNEEAIGQGVNDRRDSLNRFIAGIEDETVDPRELDVIAAYFEKEFPAAARRLQQQAQERNEELTDQAVAIMEADEALALFDAGEIGSAQARQAIAAGIATRKSLDFATGSAEQRKELADLIKREKDFQSEILLKEAQALVGVFDEFGGTPEQQLTTYTNLLKSGRLTPKDYATASDAAFDLLQAVFDARVEAADSATEQARLFATGIPVPEELQLARAYEFLQTGSIAYQEFLFIASSGLQEYAEAITWTAADLYSKGNITMTEAIRQSIQAQIIAVAVMKQTAITNLKKAARFGEPVSVKGATEKYDSQIAALVASLSSIPEIDIPDFGTFGVDPARAAASAEQAAEEAKRAREEAAQKAHDIAIAELELQKARVEGDPVKEAQLDRRIAQENERFAAASGDRAGQLRAQAERIRADRAAAEARSAIYLAQSELGAAVRGDPIGDAYNAVIAAQEAIRMAQGTAERLSAMAAKVRAQRELNAAFQDIGIANLELAQAFADAAGNSIKSAEIALKIAKQQLANIKKNTPNDQAAILRAQANVVAQEAALRDADLAERERAIDVALQLEQITVQQAIQQLQALLTLPGLTKEQIDNLLIKIKSMKDELSGDFQFNLPTVFGLPTAYEARRVDQTAGGSSAYNDNRIITVTVNASTDADPAAIAATVASVIGEPNRTGTVPKKF